ncbi:hypothetical protein BDZ91DRAFT_729509 [Kalaharituber pfeilii]|nr:hypothetical protein BDZ91DRAFT_729509 [Kalaharituber pfeilii]
MKYCKMVYETCKVDCHLYVLFVMPIAFSILQWTRLILWHQAGLHYDKIVKCNVLVALHRHCDLSLQHYVSGCSFLFLVTDQDRYFFFFE